MHAPRKRSAAGGDTSARILDAARALAVEEGFSGFTIEKVAARAGVSRMTVYYQFGTKRELLEALFDHMAARGRIDRLDEAFSRPDPLDALEQFIHVFCGFWESDRQGLRRLRSWAALEAASGESPRGQDAWRRDGLETLVARIRQAHGVPDEGEVSAVVDLLHMLTSFESYDNLARGGRSEGDVAALLTRSARAIVGVGTEPR